MTQLIFDHALRMRIHVESKDHVKEEIPELVISRERSEASSENAQSTSGTAGQDDVSNDSGTTTPRSKKEPDREDVKPDTKNIAGRLKNLVCSDMANLHGGQGLMLISEYFLHEQKRDSHRHASILCTHSIDT